MELAGRSLWVALQASLPVLLAVLVTGVLVSIFQAVTQIQEMTLTFIPKILAAVAVVALLGPLMLNQMLAFTQWLFRNVPSLVR